MIQPQTVRWPALTLESLRALVPILLFAAIGVELIVLATWLPDTLSVWFNPEKNGFGDFPVFYRNARTFSLNALYSPGLTVVMHPLTYMSMRSAFIIYTGVNVAALLGVAYLAQRAVASMPAKAAVFLGVLALPQTHWAIRVGHFTEVLAFAALAGLMLGERKPVVAGLLIAVLALKPQYLPLPLLYFAFSRNWRAVAACVGALVLLGFAGIAASVIRDPSMLTTTGHYYVERVPALFHLLTADQRDMTYQQGWQYSWFGFLLSIGLQPNPLIAFDLIALSVASVGLVWWKGTPGAAKVAAALGMLLLAPHSTFYNWSMLSVAGALLLRAEIRPRWVVPAMLVGMVAAAAASQNATPFPLPYDAYRPADTLGVYWVQPAALASIFLLLIIGRRDRTASAPNGAPETVAARAPLAVRPPFPVPLPQFAISWRMAPAALAAVVAGYFGGAWVTNSGPYRTDPYFGRANVLGALPSDFPLPDGASLDGAGPGLHLPYRVEWDAPGPTSDVAGIMRQKLDEGTWRIVDSGDADGGVRLRSARPAADGQPPMIAELDITPDGAGSKLRLEFSPLPSSLVPGYEDWLRSVGLVIHNVDPNSAAADLTLVP
jgi:hypothetical protein